MVSKKLFHEIFLILLGICWSITIIFSLTMLIILRRYWHKQCRSTVNLLTCNCCVALIFFVITSSIQLLSLIEHLSDDIPPNSILCQIYACLATFGAAIEVYSFLIQAISRFFMTILYKHKYLLTYRTSWMLIIMIILYGIILYHTARHTRINPNSASILRAKRNKPYSNEC